MKIILYTPIISAMEPETMQCIMNMIRLSKHDISWRLKIGDGLISRVRNICGQEIVDSDADYLMFIDDDIVWDVNDNPIDRLVEKNKDIVGGVYVTRSMDHHPVIRTLATQESKINKEEKIVKTEITDELQEVVYIGTGFLLIKRSCLAEVYNKHHYPFMPLEDETGEYLSEDYAFCYRARALGFKVYADTSINLGHIGKQIFSIRDYNKDYGLS